MPRVVFTPHLMRHLACSTLDVTAATLAEALEAAFVRTPPLRGYLLDDQGRVRQHVMIFVDGQPIADRERQSDPLTPASEVYVMQALSGG